MIIKVLGPGCANCEKLERLTVQAVARLGIDAEVVKVSDLPTIMSYGVMATPALVIDDELRLAGRVPTLEQLVDLIARSQ